MTHDNKGEESIVESSVLDRTDILTSLRLGGQRKREQKESRNSKIRRTVKCYQGHCGHGGAAPAAASLTPAPDWAWRQPTVGQWGVYGVLPPPAKRQVVDGFWKRSSDSLTS